MGEENGAEQRSGRRVSVESDRAATRKSASEAPIRAATVQNRLPVRIFTVDNLPGGRKIQAVRFPQLRHSLFSPVCAGHERNLRGETMNKADLVDRIAGACEISKASATTAIDTAVESITGALRKGDRVALIGFGTFSVSQRKARNGRNPQTGATIKIAARKVAKFTPGAELKKAVNKK
ncbi:MAG TPA: HU family DNA-binding protein [Candidatus Sulfotelmatobacter sp.]